MSKAFENYLSKCIKKYRDSIIKDAMVYSVDGGKRFRPEVIFSILKGYGINEKEGYAAASALEFIQTYSLIHDDLPAMDNDDYRRGKPSTHKKFGEAIGILTGDALLTHAFSIINDPNNKLDADTSRKLSYILSKYSGLDGMIYGQLLDITSSNKKVNDELLYEIHDNKTSGLFKYCCLAAMYIAKENNYKYFEKLGSKIGIIFQLQDDLFDAIKSEKEMGKSLSDKDNDKLTALSIYSVEELNDYLEYLFKDIFKYLDKANFDTKYIKDLLIKIRNR